jgi:hypothetical protein
MFDSLVHRGAFWNRSAQSPVQSQQELMMELQLTSERAVFPLLTGASSRQYRDEQPLKQTEAQGEDRERRRIEFRASLTKARAAFEAALSCQPWRRQA